MVEPFRANTESWGWELLFKLLDSYEIWNVIIGQSFENGKNIISRRDTLDIFFIINIFVTYWILMKGKIGNVFDKDWKKLLDIATSFSTIARTSTHWRHFWARKRNVCEQRVRDLSTLIDAHAGLSLTQTIPSCQIARLTRWCVPSPDRLTSCLCWPSWLILISAITMISTMMMWSLTLCRSTHCPQSCLARLMLIRRWGASNSPAESDRVESRTSDLPSLFVNQQQVSTDRRPNLPQANSLENLPPSSFPSRLCHFSSSHLLLLTLIRGGSSLWSNPSCVPVITKILPRKSSTHLPTSVEIMSQSTSHCGTRQRHLCPLPRSDDYWARQATAEPAVAVAATQCGSLGAYLEHILTRVFFHTRGHPAPRVIKCLFFRSTQLAIPGVHPASESHSSFTRARRKNWGSLILY